MTERQFLRDGVDKNKIQQECEFIFKHLEEKDFSLLEIKYLMSSMGLVMADIVKKTR